MTGPAADRTSGLWPAGSNIKKIQGIPMKKLSESNRSGGGRGIFNDSGSKTMNGRPARSLRELEKVSESSKNLAGSPDPGQAGRILKKHGRWKIRRKSMSPISQNDAGFDMTWCYHLQIHEKFCNFDQFPHPNDIFQPRRRHAQDHRAS